MQIYIYSDESGVFDVKHNHYFVFGGLIFLSKDAKDIAGRKYLHVERNIKKYEHLDKTDEVKASLISNKGKGKLFRSLNNEIKFGVVIDEEKVLPQIFENKKDKQRYQDYAYKIAVKRCFSNLIAMKEINPDEKHTLYFFVDEHSTATNGRYELREALLNELFYGTYNLSYSKFFPPILPESTALTLHYCNSQKVPLVRAADIVANNIYHKAIDNPDFQSRERNFYIIRLP